MVWGIYKFYLNVGFIVEISFNIFFNKKIKNMVFVELYNFSLYVFIKSKNI